MLIYEFSASGLIDVLQPHKHFTYLVLLVLSQLQRSTAHKTTAKTGHIFALKLWKIMRIIDLVNLLI